MISVAHARTMAAYSRWMNDALYACAAQLADSVRKEDAGAFFKSIHGTLNHLLLADRLWMGRITGVPFKVGSLAEELYADFDELRAERRKTDEAITTWADALTDARLGETLVYTSIVNPAETRMPLWFVLTHFFNHQTHHRGQVTTLLMQRGVDPDVTDLLRMPGGPR
jgi:uncharacterized damage-inducible protein DinB